MCNRSVGWVVLHIYEVLELLPRSGATKALYSVAYFYAPFLPALSDSLADPLTPVSAPIPIIPSYRS